MRMPRLIAALFVGSAAVAATPASAHRPVPHVRPAVVVGDVVSVAWGGGWYDARVLAVGPGGLYVDYLGWSDAWNEWVDYDRVNVTARVAPVDTSWVYWRGTWFPTRVVDRRAGWIRVRYDAWGRGYDGWVRPGRLVDGSRRPSHRPVPVHGRHDDEPVRPRPDDDSPSRPPHDDHDRPSRPDDGHRPSQPSRPDDDGRPSQPGQPTGVHPEGRPDRPTTPGQPGQPTNGQPQRPSNGQRPGGGGRPQR